MARLFKRRLEPGPGRPAPRVRSRRGYVSDESRRRRGDIPWRRVAAAPRPRRGCSVETSRGGFAAATRIFRGDESRGSSEGTGHVRSRMRGSTDSVGSARLRRGRDADIPWRRVALAPRVPRGSSEGTMSEGARERGQRIVSARVDSAAATTWMYERDRRASQVRAPRAAGARAGRVDERRRPADRLVASRRRRPRGAARVLGLAAARARGELRAALRAPRPRRRARVGAVPRVARALRERRFRCPGPLRRRGARPAVPPIRKTQDAAAAGPRGGPSGLPSARRRADGGAPRHVPSRRGDSADASRRRRSDVHISRRGVAATPRLLRGYSVQTESPRRREYFEERSRGDAAAATWIFRGDGVVAATPRPRRGYSAETEARRRYDSVAVPHEVLAVGGDAPRFALAGWFHQDQQLMHEPKGGEVRAMY